MFDYTMELREVTYLIDYEYDGNNRKGFIYIINHKNKTMQKHIFSYLFEMQDYILDNNIESVVFYGLGDMTPLYNNLKAYNVVCSVDREIYYWRMKNLSPSERCRTTPLYYYAVQGYKYDAK